MPLRARKGMTLLEIVVVIAILAAVMAIAIPSISGVMHLQQSGAAEELGLTYKYLRDEAALRRVSFRIAFNLDARTYKVEVGDASALVFSGPEERAKYEEDLQSKLKRFTKRELEEGAATELEDKMGRYEGLSDPALESEVTLPNNSFFAWVYTPQYAEPQEPSDPAPEDPEDQKIVYSYVFPNGTTEYTLIRIADIDDPEEGFTLEIEPLSGRVRISPDILMPSMSMAWLPEQGPELPR